jgi:hypothetical protein
VIAKKSRSRSRDFDVIDEDEEVDELYSKYASLKKQGRDEEAARLQKKIDTMV